MPAFNPSRQVVSDIEHLTVAMVHFHSEGGGGLVAPGKGMMRAYCGAVWISKHELLTAAHCPKDESAGLFILLRDDWHPDWMTVHEVHVVLSDDIHDLAALRIVSDEEHPIAKVRLSSIGVTMGEELHLVGHPAGFLWTYSRAYVSQIRPGSNNANDFAVKAFQVDGPIWMGYSGSGAFDMNGNLVGIASWMRGDAPNMGFYLHADEIRRFASKLALD
jgi:S1-C subfamily serine protease